MQKDIGFCVSLAWNLPSCFSENKHCMSLGRRQVPTRHSFSLPTGIKKTSKWPGFGQMNTLDLDSEGEMRRCREIGGVIRGQQWQWGQCWQQWRWQQWPPLRSVLAYGAAWSSLFLRSFSGLVSGYFDIGVVYKPGSPNFHESVNYPSLPINSVSVLGLFSIF